MSTLRELYKLAVNVDLPRDHGFFSDLTCSAARSGVESGARGILDWLNGRPIDDLFYGGFVVITARIKQKIVGAAFAAPVPQLASMFSSEDERVRAGAVNCALSVAKLSAVAVTPEFQGLGVGKALVQTLLRIYEACGTAFIYGEYDLRSPHLAEFYRDQGFTLAKSTELIDLTQVLGRQFFIGGTDHEQRFVYLIHQGYPYEILVAPTGRLLRRVRRMLDQP